MKGSDGLKWPDARMLAERMVERTDGTVRLILMYGSRLQGTNPDRHSALDFVVIVNGYREFYTAFSKNDKLHRSVSLLIGLAGVLAPNVMAFTPNDGRCGVAKCLVVSKDDFSFALGPTPPDHFLLGRMVQRLGLVWASDPSEERWIRTQIEGAHLRVLDWMAPYLVGPVDAPELGRRLLEVCYHGEFRPESHGRAGRVFEVQADHFSRVLMPTLDAAVDKGTMRREGDRYVLCVPSSARERRRWRRHFRRSKVRTTLRWFKHVVTFAHWLPYVARKVERHTDRTIKLTALERKFPLIFLWPRAIHVLLTRPRREIDR